MLYQLSKLSFGASKPEILFDIQIDFCITGLCHIPNKGFLFLFRDNHFIGFSDYRGNIKLPWMGIINERGNSEGTAPLFSYPSSVCYYPNLRRCFLIEDGGRVIKYLDMDSEYCGNVLTTGGSQKYFSNIKSLGGTKTSCDVNRYGNLYWCIREMHRCFKMNADDNMVVNYAGNGKSGFGVSNSLDACLMSRPSGIKCIDDSVFISDEGNHCIRKIDGGVISVFAGHPLSEQNLSFPSQIKSINGIMYVLDGQHVKYISLNDKNIGIIYTSPNIVGIEVGSRKEVYILETYEKESGRN